MDLTMLSETPPWDWPTDAKDALLATLLDEHADESDRGLAAELAGDLAVVDDEVVEALLAVVSASNEPEGLRGQAVVGLGPALEHAHEEGFWNPDDIVISESVFLRARRVLRGLYMDADVPVSIRQCVLEASVRAPEDWHVEAIRTAYASGDPLWELSAVFAMRWVRGFDEQILEALASEDVDLEYEAIQAAGRWAIDAAWPHVAGLLTGGTRDKGLILAAIEAAANIRPREAPEILADLIEAGDEVIEAAAHEAIALAESCEEFELDDEIDQDEHERDEGSRNH